MRVSLGDTYSSQPLDVPDESPGYEQTWIRILEDLSRCGLPGPGNRLTFDIIVGRVGRAWELGRTHEPSEGSTGGSCREGPIHKSPLHDNGEGVTGNGTCAPGAQGPEMANAAGDEGSNTNLEGDDVVNRPRVRHGGETDTEVTLRRDSQNGEYD